MMKRQEAFDVAARHLLTQNKRATNGTYCLYLTADGDKCAIGALMTSPSGDLKLSVFKPTVLRHIDPRFGTYDELVKDLHFLGPLQSVHDAYGPEVWPEKLVAFAKAWGLRDDVVAETLAARRTN